METLEDHILTPLFAKYGEWDVIDDGQEVFRYGCFNWILHWDVYFTNVKILTTSYQTKSSMNCEILLTRLANFSTIISVDWYCWFAVIKSFKLVICHRSRRGVSASAMWSETNPGGGGRAGWASRAVHHLARSLAARTPTPAPWDKVNHLNRFRRHPWTLNAMMLKL
jgi:hypothetical protein